MAEVVKMPKLSDTMEEGVVAEWHKKVGDSVKEGELLAEIETDKATMEFESFQSGTLLHIGIKKGESAPVDSILAILGKKGEKIDDILEQSKTNNSETTKATEKDAEQKNTEKETTNTSATSINENTTSASESKQADNADKDRLKASPLAKKMAEEKGINLKQITGSGDGGRIVKEDIENYSPKATTSTLAGAQENYTEEPVSQIRKTIARRLTESKFSAPHFYLTVDVEMDEAIQARKMVNEHIDGKISFNDLIIKASAMALVKHPNVNSAWLGDKIRKNQHVHIGVAVAVPDGLLVPVIKYAHQKNIQQIGEEVKSLAELAKNKKLQPDQMQGNTFSISNLGMFGIEEFTAIINPPNSCILAVGGIRQEPIVKNDNIVPGNKMKLTLSCDHRVVDGATGAAFLQTLKAMLENPVMMLV